MARDPRSPGKQQIEQERKGQRTLGKTLLSTAAMMIGWGIGLKVSKGASHLINRKMGTTAFKWALDERSPSHRFARAVYHRAKRYASKTYPADRAASITRKLDKTRGVYLRARDETARSIIRMKGTFETATKDFSKNRYWMGTSDKMLRDVGFTNVRKVKGIGKKTIRTITELKKKDIRANSIMLNIETLKRKPFIRQINKMRASKALVKTGDLFAKASSKQFQITGKHFDQAMKSRLYRWGTNMAAGAPFEYAAHRMLFADKDSKWYSGRAVADWMKFRVTTDIVFGGVLGRGAGAALKAVKKKIILPKSSKGYIKKLFSGFSKLSRSTAITSLHETARDIGFVDKPTSVKHLPRYISTITNSFKKHYNTYSKMKPMNRPTAANSAVADAVKFIQEQKLSKKDSSKSAMLKVLGAHNNIYTNLRSDDPNTVMSKMSWMFSKLDDVPRGATSPEIGKAIRSQKLKNTSDDMTRIFLEMAKGGANKRNLPRYFIPRKGVVDYAGQTYDMSNLMPSNISKSMAGLLGSISVFGIKPFKILGTAPYTSIEDDFAFSERGAGSRVFTGPLKDNLDEESFIQSFISSKPTDYTIKVGENTQRHLKLYNRGADDVNLAIANMRSNRLKSKTITGKPMDRMTKFKNEMSSGHIELVGNEKMWYVGKNAYYLPNSKAKAPEVFQMGLDWRTNKYNTFDTLTREHAGGLGIISNIYYGIGPYHPKEMKSRIKPTDGWFARKVHQFQDMFDLGTYDKPSVFNRLGHLLTRFQGMSNKRSYFSDKGAFDPNLLNAISTDKKLRSLYVTTTSTHLRQAQREAVEGVFNNQEMITAIRNKMKDAGVAQFGSDDVLGLLDANRNKTYTDVLKVIKKDARKLFGIKGSKVRQAAIGTTTDKARFFSSDEIDFTNALFRERDPTSAVAKMTFSGVRKQKYELLKNYDNMKIKAYLTQMKAEELDDVFAEAANSSFFSSLRKSENAMNLIKVFNNDISGPTLQEIMNNKDLASLSDELLGNYNQILRNNKSVFTEYAKHADPIWKLKGTPIPGTRSNSYNTNQGDLMIARNKTALGETIRGYWDSIMPKLTTMDGVEFPATHLSRGGLMSMGAINAINNTAAAVGLGFSPQNIRTPTKFMKNVITKRVLPAVALSSAWRIADTVTDESGLFEGSALGQGLNVFTTEQLGKARLSIARFNDITGVTDSAKYLENIMPGSVQSPLAGALRGFGIPLLGSALGAAKGGPGGGMLGGAIGLGLSAITAGGPLAFMGQFDLTKSRADIIEEYSGRKRIPVSRGAGWLLSSSPYGGTGVEFYKPSQFHLIRSQYKYTDALYGSKTEQLANIFNPRHYMDKHKYTRPYPFGGERFANVPLIGNLTSMGGELADYPEMSYRLGVEEDGVKYSPSMQNMGLMAGVGTKSSTEMRPFSGFVGDPDTIIDTEQQAVAPNSMSSKVNAAFYGASEFAGLRGFMMQSAFENFNDGMFPFESVPVFQSASLMTSPTRAWWDSIPSDPLGTMEYVRRFVPKRGEHVNEINPIVNAMPGWLPGSEDFINFKGGDPFVKVRLGEVRLPGPGYEATHDVRFTVPLDTAYVGMSPGEALAEMTGRSMPVDPDKRFDKLLSGRMKEQIASTLTQQNAAIKTDQYVFNPLLNMSGKFDIVSGKNNGMKIKVLSPETFAKLNQARPQDTAEMNALLNLNANMQYGSLIYVDAGSGETKEFQTTKDTNKFQQDVMRTMQVKSTALDLIKQHGPKIGKGLGSSYSRVDRLSVLSDIAPYSEEYKQTLEELKSMNKLGLLSPEDQSKATISIQERESKRDRFKYTERKFTRGTAITEEEELKQSAIRREYSFAERAAGAMWERASFQDTLLTSRFVNNTTPVDVYRKNYVYGNGPIKRWEHPYRDFIKPGISSMTNRDTVAGSVASMTTAGLVFGGPLGGGLGAVAGLGWGVAHGKEEVPELARERNELMKQIDAITYINASRRAAMGDINAQKTARQTMTHTFNNNTTTEQMVASLPKTEREAMRHFVNAGTAEERERIMTLVPDYAQYILNRAWNQGNEGLDTQANPLQNADLPERDWAGYDPSLDPKDVAVKMLDNAGIEARSVGLGFQAQRRDMLRNPYIPDTFDTKMKSTTPDTSQLHNIIRNGLPGARVIVMQTQSPGIKLIVKGQYKNVPAQRESARDKYGI